MREDAIGIAGAGRLGQALGRLLREAGEPVAAIASRAPERAAAGAAFAGKGVQAVPYAGLPALAGRVLIAVSDEAIAEVADVLASAGMETGVVLHTCGARGVEILQPLAARGVSCGVLHPLQTIPSPERGTTALRGIAFGITAEGKAEMWARHIVKCLGGEAIRISPDARPLYHAAAVMASNYVVGLADAAVRLMELAGVESGTALRALAPLMEASCRNAVDLGPVEALTGPIARGDCQTVGSHLRGLRDAPETVRGLFRAAGLHTLDVARRRGLEESTARQLEDLLRDNRTQHA